VSSTEILPAAIETSQARSVRQRAFGAYELRGEISRGGMGIVYRAWHPTLEREVALKVMRMGSPSTEELARFNLEVQATAALDHPCIVKVLDSGEVEGQPYYAMELVQGSTLADLVRRRILTRDQTCQLAIEVASALHHAHAAGLLHRDLKPSNVLVDAAGHAKLFDFGLAKRLAPDAARITESGFVVGTPNYMSPEQARGDAQLTPASDLFSLGALFYEMLTGEMAFPGHDGRAVLDNILSTDPVRPTQIDPTLEPDLELIALKALAKDIDDRYLSAAVFAQDIRNVLEERATIARAPSLFERLWRYLRRHRESSRWFALLIAAVVGLAAWHAIHAAQLGARIREGAAKIAELERAWTKEREQAAMHQAQALLFSALLQVERSRWGEALLTLDRALQLDPGLAEARYQKGRVLYEIGREASARRDLPTAMERLARSVEIDATRADAWLLLAQAQLALGLAEPAERSARRHLDLASVSREGALLLGQVHLAAGRVQPALAQASVLTEHHPQWAEGWVLLGRVLLEAGDPGRAIDALDRAIGIESGAQAYHHRARARLAKSELERALDDANAALVRAKDDPPTLFLRSRIYERLHRPTEAREDLARVVSLRTSVPVDDARYHAFAHTRLGRWAEALSAATRWSRLVPSSAEPWRLIAEIHERAGQLEQAIGAWEYVIDREPTDERARSALERLRVGQR